MNIPKNKSFYDYGWNDRCKNIPLVRPYTWDYAVGWKDCDTSNKEDRKEMS